MRFQSGQAGYATDCRYNLDTPASVCWSKLFQLQAFAAQLLLCICITAASEKSESDFALIAYLLTGVLFYIQRSSVLPVMFLFSTRNLRAPSADRRETLPHDRKLTLNYRLSLKIGGGAFPKKIFGGQNMRNFGQFWTTPDFDLEYIRNYSRYPKSES